MKKIVIIAFLFALSACGTPSPLEVRVKDLCKNGCTDAKVIRETTFQEDTYAHTFSHKCGLHAYGKVRLQPGTKLQVVKRGPGSLLGKLALVIYYDGSKPHLGWVDEDNIGEWSPNRPLPDYPDFCDSF